MPITQHVQSLAGAWGKVIQGVQADAASAAAKAVKKAPAAKKPGK